MLHVKANSKEICEDTSFPSFLKKMLMPAFLLIFKANHLEKNCVATPFFFVDSNSPCKDLLFPCDPNLAHKTFVFSSHSP